VVLDSVVIGGISLSVDDFHENAQLSYSLARVHWGKGLTTEAATAIVDWGFGELGLAKVYGNSDLRHVASWRVMEKIGMTREGVLRSHRRAREGRSDRVYYGILREDWETATAGGAGGRP
jgi:RimJ/RimL family protein N-acetyltransferase